MGKLGARELNYGSDIDIVLVGGGDPSELVVWPARRGVSTWRCAPRVAAGPLVRSLASYIGVLGPVGADVGVPGPAQGQAGRRQRRAGRRLRPRRRPSGFGAVRSAPTSCGRCGP